MFINSNKATLATIITPIVRRVVHPMRASPNQLGRSIVRRAPFRISRLSTRRRGDTQSWCRRRTPTTRPARVALLVRLERRGGCIRAASAPACTRVPCSTRRSVSVILGRDPAADTRLGLVARAAAAASDAAENTPENHKRNDTNDDRNRNGDLEVRGVPCLGSVDSRAGLASATIARSAITAWGPVDEAELQDDTLIRGPGILTRDLAALVVSRRAGTSEVQRNASGLTLQIRGRAKPSRARQIPISTGRSIIRHLVRGAAG